MQYVDAINRAVEMSERAERIDRAMVAGRSLPGDERRRDDYRRAAEQALHSAERLRANERESLARILATSGRDAAMASIEARWDLSGLTTPSGWDSID